MPRSPSTKSDDNPRSFKQTKAIHETAEHARLKLAIKNIAKTSGFKFDTEVALNFTGYRDSNDRLIDERSIDVAVFASGGGKASLLIFECKGGSDLKEVNKKLSAWEADIDKIRQGKAKIVGSEDNTLEESGLSKFSDIRVCYVFGRGTDPQRYEQLAKILRGRGFYAWDITAVTYYSKTAETIRKAAKYQILREFDVSLESDDLYGEQAIQLTQGNLEMFVFGAKPSALMKIAYVYRRASGKPSAYQRIVSKERIERISNFLRSKGALLPNAIIIAFDNEASIQKQIRYEEGKLYFPNRYCSAWIIDGQHRVFGFIGTRYETDEDDSAPTFKVPVVAFKRMDLIPQNRTFVSINYNQKKIDPNLLCDLATQLPDLNNELTWPSLLVAQVNRLETLKDRVKISELHKGRPITITSFARFALLEGLLGYDRKTRSYRGPLYAYAPFNPKASVNNTFNRKSMNRQVALLQRYLAAVRKNTSRPDENKDPWRNTQRYSLLKPTGMNALLLVLSRVMEKYPNLDSDMHKSLETYLKPLRKVTYARASVAKQGGGWKGFRNLANAMLRKLNAGNGDGLRLFGQREKI